MQSNDAAATETLLDGRYQLGHCIGEGGMARVYRAEDIALGRTVAVKVLRAGAEGVAAPGRARAEMTMLASLSHPSLVTLFDARIAPGRPDYLVMEFVDGPTLEDRLGGGPLPVAEVAQLALDLAEALHVVHSAGVVHRDLKPSNVLLAPAHLPGRTYRAKLADFGIAYLLDSARTTSPGMVVGTAAYLAPEQVRGAAPAPAADIYSFGLLLLQALTGERPFAPATGTEALVVRLSSSPAIPDSVPPEWAALLRDMTASEPDARPTAMEVATAALPLSVAAAGMLASTSAVPVAVAAATVAADPAVGEAVIATDAVATSEGVVQYAPAPVTVADAAAEVSEVSPRTRPLPVGGVPTSSPAERPGPARRRSRRVALVGAAAALATALGATGFWLIGNQVGSPSPGGTAPAVTEPSPAATPPAEQEVVTDQGEETDPEVVPVDADTPTGDDAPADTAGTVPQTGGGGGQDAGTTPQDPAPDEEAPQPETEDEQKAAEQAQRKAEQAQQKAAEEAARAAEKAQRQAELDQKRAEEADEQPPAADAGG